MRIKRWCAVAEGYSRGHCEYFWTELGAVRWLAKQHDDRLYYVDRWRKKKVVIKDRLRNAKIAMNYDGTVIIQYQDT